MRGLTGVVVGGRLFVLDDVTDRGDGVTTTVKLGTE